MIHLHFLFAFIWTTVPGDHGLVASSIPFTVTFCVWRGCGFRFLFSVSGGFTVLRKAGELHPLNGLFSPLSIILLYSSQNWFWHGIPQFKSIGMPGVYVASNQSTPE